MMGFGFSSKFIKTISNTIVHVHLYVYENDIEKVCYSKNI